jgi:hypothetical protein
MSSPTHPDGIVDRESVDRRQPRLAPRFTRTATVEQPGIDHDDLLALLDRPRPSHGDIHMLLRRRSITKGEDEEESSSELTRRRW